MGAGVLLALDNLNRFELPEGAKILAGNQNGEITLYDYKGEIVFHAQLKTEAEKKKSSGKRFETDEAVPYFVYRYEDQGGYVYDNANCILYSFNIKNNEIQYDEIYRFDELQLLDFTVDKKDFYFITGDRSSIYLFDGNSFIPLIVDLYIEDFDLDKEANVIYVAASDTLYKISRNEKISVYLGDKTCDIMVSNKNIYVCNQFGSTMQKLVVHKFTKELVSLGWAEIIYAGQTEFIEEKDGYIYLSQCLQKKQSRVVRLGNKYNPEYGKLLNQSYDNIRFTKYGMYANDEESLFVFDKKNKVKKLKVNGSDIKII